MRNDLHNTEPKEHLKALASRIATCFQTGQEYPHTEVNHNVARLAIEELIQQGHLNIAEDFISRTQLNLESEIFNALLRILRALPRDYNGKNFVPAVSSNDEFTLIKGNGKKNILIVVFTGQALRFNFPLPIVYGFLRATGCHILYLRDKSKTLFSAGIACLPSPNALISKIRETHSLLCCDRTAVLGSSSGSFAALHYAPKISASHLVCLAGPTRLDPFDKRPHIRNLRETLTQRGIPEEVASKELSILDGRIRYYYGEHNILDRANGEHIAKTGFAESVGIRGHQNHVVLDALCEIGCFQSDLDAITENRDFQNIEHFEQLFATRKLNL